MKILIAAAAVAGLSGAALCATDFGLSTSASVSDDAVQSLRLAQGGKSARSGNSATSPVVVELFTSQSCSSCPPADALAAKLARDPGLVIISRPVTYWDQLGWKDTLGRPENTALQRAYAKRGLGGRNGVYTPQSVVNGAQGVVGSREADLRSLIARASANASSADIAVTPRDSGGYTVAVSGNIDGAAQVSLVALDRSETVGIGRGENHGRTVTYTNVVRGEDVLGRWTGGKRNFTVTPSALMVSGANRYAVLVQKSETGPILAGRYLK